MDYFDLTFNSVVFLFTIPFSDVTAPQFEDTYTTMTIGQCADANYITKKMYFVDRFDSAFCFDQSVTWPDKKKKEQSEIFANNLKKSLDN